MVGAWTRMSCPSDTLVMLLWDNFDKLIYVKLKDGGDICFVIFLEMFGRVLRQLGCSWDVLVVDPGLVPKLQEFWWILPEATSILCRKEQRETFPKPSSKDLFGKNEQTPKKTNEIIRKIQKTLMQFWCSFDAVLMQFSKLHQNCIKTASKLHQNDAVLMQFWKLHQNSIKTASKLHQNCISVFWIFLMISFVFFEFAHFFK